MFDHILRSVPGSKPGYPGSVTGSEKIYMIPGTVELVRGMPEVTDDERGRRVFQIHKQMAVEKALDKIRQNIGQDWKIYSAKDIDLLKYLLGESWVSLDRRKWEGFTFTRLQKNHLDEIIRMAKEVKKKERQENEAVMDVIGILSSVS